jgi:hypothetical protein
MNARAVALAALPAAVLFAAVLYLAAHTEEAESPLHGVSATDFENIGISPAEPGADPEVSRWEAIAAARPWHGGDGDVRQVLLARLTGEPAAGGLVWVVSLEPDSIVPVPPLGPGPASSPVDLETVEVVFSLVFVDAQTGQVVQGLERSTGEPLKDASQPVLGRD